MKRSKNTLTAMAFVAVLGLISASLPAMAQGGDQPVAKSSGSSSAPAEKAPKAPRAAKKAPPAGKVSLNEASLTQLQTLPRIGAAVAQRIIDYRTANKGFKTLEELRNVKGVGPKVFEGLKPYLTL